MNFQTLAFVFGCLLLLIAVIGGGFEVKELKLPSVSTVNRAVSLVLGSLFIWLSYYTSRAESPPNDHVAAVSSDVTMSKMEFDVDRPGSDISGHLNPSNDPHTCEVDCRKNAMCKAWTFVKPGIQDVQSKCWLKDSIPEPKRTTNCISGVKSGV